MLGLIGHKVGMTQIFSEDGTLIPVTILELPPNLVVERRIVAKHGYEATVLGVKDIAPKYLNKAVRGQFESRSLAPKRLLREFRDYEHECEVGKNIDLSLLDDIEYVDVTGFTKGKGFQGVMKRHGFGGGRKTHGSKFHREGGSTGMAATPSRVIKGTKMAGRMGVRRVTVKNLQIIERNREQNRVSVLGAVPGTKGSMVLIYQSQKKGGLI